MLNVSFEAHNIILFMVGGWQDLKWEIFSQFFPRSTNLDNKLS